MSTALLVAGTVMDKSAALMNDVDKTVYTYPIQVPYLQSAMQELQEYFALHNASVTDEVSVVIPVNAGVTEIKFDTGTSASLPPDMIEIQKVWVRGRNTNPFIPIGRVDFLSHSQEGTLTGILSGYMWQGQILSFPAANQDSDIKIDYVRSLFTDIIDETSPINIINARSFLEFRTAGLLAEFVAHDEGTAQKNNGYASLAMDRSLGISIKGKQSMVARRRPFRSGWKRNG